MKSRSSAAPIRFLALSALVAVLTLAPPTAMGARPLPTFDVRLLDGTPFNPAALAGKVAVIDFWGTWCKPCLQEIPEYNELYSKYGARGLVLVAVAVSSGTEDQVRAATQRLKMKYPVAAPEDKQLDGFGDIAVFPTTWVVNRRGEIVKEFVGTPSAKHRDLRRLVDRLLAER